VRQRTVMLYSRLNDSRAASGSSPRLLLAPLLFPSGDHCRSLILFTIGNPAQGIYENPAL
jgi:hypothetical protein